MIRNMATDTLQRAERVTSTLTLVLAVMALVLGMIVVGRLYPPPSMSGSGPRHSLLDVQSSPKPAELGLHPRWVGLPVHRLR
jgi:hypothetical protein